MGVAMGYDVKSDKMDWKDEFSWFVIAIVSGSVLSMLFIHFDKFSGTSPITIIFFYMSWFLPTQHFTQNTKSKRTGHDWEIRSKRENH